MKITYSIIAPIYNEKDNLPELYRRVKATMDSSGQPWELILVDDGTTDGSTERIRELAKADKHVRPVIFARNFGHQPAITAGWDYARGEAVVIIDADLQDPPEVILELAKKWQEGYEVVYAVRAGREGETSDEVAQARTGAPPGHRLEHRARFSLGLREPTGTLDHDARRTTDADTESLRGRLLPVETGCRARRGKDLQRIERSAALGAEGAKRRVHRDAVPPSRRRQPCRLAMCFDQTCRTAATRSCPRAPARNSPAR